MMKLIKVSYEDNAMIAYFSSKKNAADFLNIACQNINYYINKDKRYKGWKIEESYDNIMTSEVNEIPKQLRVFLS